MYCQSNDRESSFVGLESDLSLIFQPKFCKTFFPAIRVLVMYKQEVLTMKWQGAVSCWSSVRWHLTTTPKSQPHGNISLRFVSLISPFTFYLMAASHTYLQTKSKDIKEPSDLCIYFLSIPDNQFHLSYALCFPPSPFLVKYFSILLSFLCFEVGFKRDFGAAGIKWSLLNWSEQDKI